MENDQWKMIAICNQSSQYINNKVVYFPFHTTKSHVITNDTMLVTRLFNCIEFRIYENQLNLESQMVISLQIERLISFRNFSFAINDERNCIEDEIKTEDNTLLLTSSVSSKKNSEQWAVAGSQMHKV